MFTLNVHTQRYRPFKYPRMNIQASSREQCSDVGACWTLADFWACLTAALASLCIYLRSESMYFGEEIHQAELCVTSRYLSSCRAVCETGRGRCLVQDRLLYLFTSAERIEALKLNYGSQQLVETKMEQKEGELETNIYQCEAPTAPKEPYCCSATPGSG